ncbi:MAG TPA: hypothetical protein VMS92_15060 [Mycobacterium sp.]|nr:hypothetical protein [Mycobacterium sp.]
MSASGRLGRIVHHDPKSRDHAFIAAAGLPTRHVRHAMNAPHVDQFFLSGCVGFSGTNMLNTAYAIRSRRKFNAVVPIGKAGSSYLGNKDGIRNYHEATLRDPYPGKYPPDDEGSSAIGLMKWWKEVGVITSYAWTFTFDDFLTALSRQPVLCGTNWYDDMYATGPDGIIQTAASGEYGGHEYLATEIIPSKKLLGFEQSWGQHPPGFGNRKGRFYMSYDLAEELIIHQQGDVAVPKLI